ncbi:MAG: arylesterase [Lachnospiraceae bacterium]|nr:arylesterase [Lachnospiraceae bacterium]
MKTIVAFGDSNTWGLVPKSEPHERYPEDVRWTGVLQGLLKDARVVEEGLCGRTTVFEDELRPGRKGLSMLPVILESQYPVDAVIIMLGTNDCKSVYGASAHTIGKGMELCIDELKKYVPAEKILLVSPIFLGNDVWWPDKDPEFGPRSVEVSKELKAIYVRIAEAKGTAFLAASDHAYADDLDNEHMNEKGHASFAKAVYEKLVEMRIA